MSETPRFSVSEFVSLANQSFEYAYSNIQIEGEVSQFKISKGKWGFFDLKDEESTINCFVVIFNLRQPITDGMKVIVSGTPRITKIGRFSFTVNNIQPIGKGNIKKSFDLLKEKLEKEGLFSPDRKRPIPNNLETIGVISSTTAAGYHDFIKILNERWSGIRVIVGNTGVQGLSAADEIIRALHFFNEHGTVEAIAIVRGGGSADDLAVFNDEKLAREIACSKIPIITGIGHEVDESLADLAADVRASTPTNAAELITRSRASELSAIKNNLLRIKNLILTNISALSSKNHSSTSQITQKLYLEIDKTFALIEKEKRTLSALNPEKVLKQGYAILSGKISPGSLIKITTYDKMIESEVKNVKKRN